MSSPLFDDKAALLSANSSGTIDIVGRLRQRLTLGKEAERRLVESILADSQYAAHASIADIAARAGVSEPTITRLARALGFSGTRDMRIHLAQTRSAVTAHECIGIGRWRCADWIFPAG